MYAVYAYVFITANGTRGLKVGLSNRPSRSYQQFKNKYAVRMVGGIALLSQFEDRQQAYDEERELIRCLRETNHRHLRLQGRDSRPNSIGQLYSRETFYWGESSC